MTEPTAKDPRLCEERVAPLVALATEIAAARGLPGGAVPYPDPDTGGTGARALVLLESPAASASAAERLRAGYASAGLDPAQVLHWNAVPWSTQRRSPSAAELREARTWLPRLLALLGELRVAVLLGVPAQQYWGPGIAEAPGRVPLVPVLAGPHPSQAGADDRLATVLRRTADVVGAETAPAAPARPAESGAAKADRSAEELTAGYDLAYRGAARFFEGVFGLARSGLRSGSRGIPELRRSGRGR
jgi:hypothetical protein